jgi:putative membrane protein
MTDRAAAGAQQPDIATTLAYERTRIAYERTMMAWIRTAASLITFGFSLYKFFEFELKGAPPGGMLLGPRGFGIALICVGLLSLLLGTFEHGRDMRALRQRYVDMPKSMSGVVALVLGALGLCALAAGILRA